MVQSEGRMSTVSSQTDRLADPLTVQDTGLGTTFERWALNRYLQRLRKEKAVTTVLEGPGDGMTGITGINSLILALNGADVTVVLPNSGQAEFARKVWSHYLGGRSAFWKIVSDDSLPAGRPTFDLVWNFNVMTRRERPWELLEAMCGLSRRFVLIFVPNRQNYSFPLHRLHHKIAKQAWDHGARDLMSPDIWLRTFAGLGFHRCETGWLDCPWWPDIVDFGQLISDFFPFLERSSQRAKPQNRLAWPWDHLPYYQLESFPEIKDRMERLAFFENTRLTFVKKRFAHHIGILAEKDE
jgi:hypothetical protein